MPNPGWLIQDYCAISTPFIFTFLVRTFLLYFFYFIKKVLTFPLLLKFDGVAKRQKFISQLSIVDAIMLKILCFLGKIVPIYFFF